MRRLIINEQDRQELIRAIQAIELDGSRKYVGEIKVFRMKRSLKQNSLYWMWLRCIKAETGNDMDDLHNYFTGKFLAWSVREVFGSEVPRHLSTADLDTKQFTEFLEQVRMDMANQAITLPNPGDYGWDAFYTQYGQE
jgi:hypothetical protein